MEHRHGWPLFVNFPFNPSMFGCCLCVGSNTHNNGAPGGDGQTGDAGEGTGGERSYQCMFLLCGFG